MQKMKINYLKGDATSPIKCLESKDELRVIIHICDNINKWGKGFVLALSKKWTEPKDVYQKMNQELGTISFCIVEENICIINMIAQKGIYKQNGIPPIRYDALKACLQSVSNMLHNYIAKTSIHMPRIGCGLAGGKWDIVENLIMECLVEKGFVVCVYDYSVL